ncbi:MAG TPA: hypothetical protein VMB53_12645 [Gaiellaceae bacterium]|nr:hypothetical protein [Gaiellaceae bacterium]
MRVRLVPALVSVVVVFLAPGDVARAAGTVTVPVPPAGSVELATYTVKLKGAKLPAKLSVKLANAAQVPASVVVLAGVKLASVARSGKTKIGTYTVTTAVLQRKGRSSAAALPRIPGLLERIQQPLYNRNVVATVGTTQLNYLQVPLGGTAPGPATARTQVCDATSDISPSTLTQISASGLGGGSPSPGSLAGDVVDVICGSPGPGEPGELFTFMGITPPAPQLGPLAACVFVTNNGSTSTETVKASYPGGAGRSGTIRFNGQGLDQTNQVTFGPGATATSPFLVTRFGMSAITLTFPGSAPLTITFDLESGNDVTTTDCTPHQ